MAEKWVEAYVDLRKFIGEHPEIEIDANGACAEGDVYSAFFNHFNSVRTAFIQEHCVLELNTAYELGNAYASISKSVQKDMNLESIVVSGSLNGLLSEPLQSLKCPLYNPLINLLCGKTDENGFALEGKKAVKTFFRPLFCEGYKRWGVLSLLHLLGSSCLWSVPPNELDVEDNRNAEFHPGLYDEDVPELHQERQLAFSYILKASFVMPDVLVHSSHINAYVSLKSSWYEVRCKASTLNEDLEWLSLEQPDTRFGRIRPDLMLDTTIHIAKENANELKLLADYNLMARPDVLIEFMEDDGWYDAKRIECIILNNKAFNPRLGSYVISRVTVPPEAFLAVETPTKNLQPLAETDSVVTIRNEPSETTVLDDAKCFTLASPPQKTRSLCLADLPENIYVISAGYDPKALDPVVQAISQWLMLQELPTSQ